MRPWLIELQIDRGRYRIDLRRRRYEYIGSAARLLPADENTRNKRQLHGLRRILRDGRSRVFVDQTWPFSEECPCPSCGSWIPRDSPCDHEKYECPTCGRRQCLSHWRYPMRTRREAEHFVGAARAATGRECFVRPVEKARTGRTAVVWKIFTSEGDYRSYLATGRHKR